MPCSYVYVNGEVNAKAVVATAARSSPPSAQQRARLERDGQVRQVRRSEDRLANFVLLKYDYRVKYDFKGATRLDALTLTNNFQHSQARCHHHRGENKMTFSAARRKAPSPSRAIAMPR